MRELLLQFQDWHPGIIFGIVGGVLFFGSWLLQAWETKRQGQSVVTLRFFALRSLASIMLMLEGIRTGSISVTLVMFATFLLMLYNIHMIWKKS